ncbi:MAG: M20/M25/M40 family metallo-hydrolase, partial [Crocinitomicaceae bacterium]|nr:M20/M25/M40 family metallo-hydrolase [Crocinitomicaceae bacterium]
MNPELTAFIKGKSIALYEKVKNYREHLHQHPELSYQEVETMRFVSEKLTQLGISHETGVGGTGVVALIQSEKHLGKSCIALRADLDALPISEENEVPYKSKVTGVMHACGHDVHTAILLGAAEILN